MSTGFPTDVIYSATTGVIVRISGAIDAEFRALGVPCTVALEYAPARARPALSVAVCRVMADR